MEKLKELKVENVTRKTITISGTEVLDKLITINRDCSDPEIKNKPNRAVTEFEVKDLALEIIKDPMYIYNRYRSLIVNGDTLHILDGQHTYYSIKLAIKLAKKLGIEFNADNIPVRVELFSGPTITERDGNGDIDMDETMYLEEVFIRDLNQKRSNWKDSDNIRSGLQSSNINYRKNFVRLEEIKNYIISTFGLAPGSSSGYYGLADYISKGKVQAKERSTSSYSLTLNETLRSKNIINLIKDIEDVIIPMGSKLYIYGKVRDRNALVKGVREFYLEHQDELREEDIKNKFLKKLEKIDPTTDRYHFDIIIGSSEENINKDDIKKVLEDCLY